MSTKGKDAEIFNLRAILLNVPDQEYVIGSSYHKTNGKEHFIRCPFPNVEEKHCKISVDKEGEFWIENVDNSAKTSINREPLDGMKKLNFGDRISFEGTETMAFFYFEFQERHEKEILDPKRVTPFPDEAIDVGNNHVLVESILKHFGVEDLKKYRFVSKAWASASSQHLRKRCAVTIRASRPYEQTKLFRCSEEMKGFASTMTSLSIEIPQFFSDPSWEETDLEKFVDDLVQYLLKDCLTYFKITVSILSGRVVLLLDQILQKVSQLCPGLEHLFLEFCFEFCSLVEMPTLTLPPDSNWTFGHNLKILEVSEHAISSGFAGSILQKIDTTRVEKFISRLNFKSNFLFVIPEKNFCNLKEISLSFISGWELSALERMPPNVCLQGLIIAHIRGLEIPRLSQSLSSVLEKFSQSLVSLEISCYRGNIVLPRFERLVSLNLWYGQDTRVTFPPHFLYATNFPKLKRLTLISFNDEDEDEFFSENTKAEALAQWGLNEELFNSFVPNGQVCSSLVELNIPHCPPEAKEKNKEYSDRLKAMRVLFPNVKGKWIKAGK